MRIGSAFPSKYLRATDLPDGQFVKVTIAHVAVENVAGNGQPEEDKPVLYFVGKEKGLVLNKTNSAAISDVYGDETDDWASKPVSLYSTTTAFQGKNVACVRVKVIKGAAAAPKAAVKPVAAPSAPYQGEDVGGGSAGPMVDEDIPFAPMLY